MISLPLSDECWELHINQALSKQLLVKANSDARTAYESRSERFVNGTSRTSGRDDRHPNGHKTTSKKIIKNQDFIAWRLLDEMLRG